MTRAYGSGYNPVQQALAAERMAWATTPRTPGATAGMVGTASLGQARTPTGLAAGYMQSPDFTQGMGWLNQLYGTRESQLRDRNNEMWREVAAARGLDPTDGPIVQGSNQSLADQLANLDAARLEAMLGMQANQQGLAWQMAQQQGADQRWKQQMDFEKKQYADQQAALRRQEELQRQGLMQAAPVAGGYMPGPGGAPSGPSSSTGGIIGGPAAPSGIQTYDEWRREADARRHAEASRSQANQTWAYNLAVDNRNTNDNDKYGYTPGSGNYSDAGGLIPTIGTGVPGTSLSGVQGGGGVPGTSPSGVTMSPTSGAGTMAGGQLQSYNSDRYRRYT